MFRLINSMVLIIIINLVLLALSVLAIDLVLPDLSFYALFIIATLVFLFFMALSEYLMLYYLNAKEIRSNDKRYEIVNNFKFRNDKTKLSMFSSDRSPLILRIGFFNNTKYLINEKILRSLNEIEIQAILDLELSYSQTFQSFLEQYVQKIYFLFFEFPYTYSLSHFNKEIVEYFVAPIKLLYRYICGSLRMSFSYKGKFDYVIPQLILKTKLIEEKDTKIPLFSYSMRNIEIIQCKFKVDSADIKRINHYELYQ